jgi:hypothetical protein
MDDYVSLVTQISHELQQAWDLDQLVKAQKTVIFRIFRYLSVEYV